MKTASAPNLNRETTSITRITTNSLKFFQDPNHHDDTTLHKRPNIDHSQDTEPSETSPFKDILSPFISSNGSNENHYPVGGNFYEWDQNQMDQTLPRLPPSPIRSSDTTVSVGSNPFSGNVGARSEGPNFTQLQGDQTLPSMSSVGSYQSSGNVGARSAGPNFTKRRRPTETWTERTPDLIDDGYPWKKYAEKDVLGATHRRDYYRCTHKFDQGCTATKQVQKTDEDPPMFQSTYHGNHTCRNLHKPPQINLDSTIPGASSNSVFLNFGSTNYPSSKSNDEPNYPNYPLVKQEYFQTQEPMKPSFNHNQSTSSDQLFLFPDLTAFDSARPMPYEFTFQQPL